jgi:hypothetical protein
MYIHSVTYFEKDASQANKGCRHRCHIHDSPKPENPCTQTHFPTFMKLHAPALANGSRNGTTATEELSAHVFWEKLF